MRVETWKSQVRQLKAETNVLYLAYKDPRVSWYAKLFAICVVGYAFSLIDLILDYIPILGYLDDLILVPLGIILARKLIPQSVLTECREKAQMTMSENRPTNQVVSSIIIAIWIFLAALAVYFPVRTIQTCIS